ncbi:unnamed protein product (macronuclear) [Paramecium tetraurelia]|uniref:Uncharacterized protein n=1 Tax=Paramecium tetraurelia TaxID=5888 RepID=A0E4K7_PARTE|nr:uncharacterized protein GSPATT00023399001 [Paramecium tetraurelia]CAK90224.1 unnamed protein product [Paramecium tetraurelia]|eukprot:XP_001457621.1 hypothetical protein (macronuclear) [Paramecium tetraurelia strain d4-2]
MIKQVPQEIGKYQHKPQNQPNAQAKNKQGLKQFKNTTQQQQQTLHKQQALRYFNQQTFLIMELRLVCRSFNKLFLCCAPNLLDYIDQKDFEQQKNQNQNQQRLVFPKLIDVNITTIRENLESKAMYAYVEKLLKDNLFSVELIFDIITWDLPPWRKAKFTFPLKVKTILEKYDFNLYNLNDQQIQMINQRQNHKFTPNMLYNDDYEDIVQYVKNLMQVAAFEDYKYFCDWYEIEKENEQMQKLRQLLRSNSLQQK